MLRLIIAILLSSVMTNVFGQHSPRLMSYHAGLNFNYAGLKSPHFTLPIGAGVGVTATLNKSKKVKPTIDLSVAGFPEFVIQFSNTDHDNAKYAYAVYNLLAGTKVHLYRVLSVSVTTGPTFNSRENEMCLSVKPSIELSPKQDKVLFNLYYLKMVNSELMNGYTGVAVLVKFR